jgi:ribosome-associated protein
VTPRKDSIPPHVRAAISAAQDKMAEDVVLLDLAGLGAFTDYFLVCTGFSTPQLEAICDEIEERLKHSGTRRLHREGKPGSDWMLLDFGSLIVHAFTERARHYYDLERLWRAGRRVEFSEPREGNSSTGAAEAEG